MKTAGHGQAKVLTAVEIHRLFQEGLQHERDRALFGLCLYTGCRINEACTRLMRDVYWESGSVRAEVLIRKQDTKGQQATRSMQVHPQLRAWLEAYYPQAGQAYLFPGRWGRQYLKPTSAHKLLQAAFERVGIVGRGLNPQFPAHGADADECGRDSTAGDPGALRAPLAGGVAEVPGGERGAEGAGDCGTHVLLRE